MRYSSAHSTFGTKSRSYQVPSQEIANRILSVETQLARATLPRGINTNARRTLQRHDVSKTRLRLPRPPQSWELSWYDSKEPLAPQPTNLSCLVPLISAPLPPADELEVGEPSDLEHLGGTESHGCWRSIEHSPARREVQALRMQNVGIE